ncbi:MAG: Protein GrpE [Parcubacteria group bacterium GW2011_GWA2_49_9]|nr:MAG: Protein GrpE [Parcubacteria group bacterium GW2011_GWA2_49_9]
MTDDDKKLKNEAENEDITFETELDSDNAKDPVEMIKTLKEKLKISQKERQEYLEGWQRTKADFVNAKKHEEEERGEFVKFSKRELIKELLPTLDSFHTAFGNKEAWEKVDLNWRMGVQYIYSQLLGALEKHGITLIDPKVGEPFDPAKHASISTVPTANKAEDHTVQAVVQKGYALHGKILEPARVKIYEYRE